MTQAKGAILLATTGWDQRSWSEAVRDLATGLEQALERHTASVQAVAFDAEGDLLATGSCDRDILIWNRDGAVVRTLKGHRGCIRAHVSRDAGQKIDPG